MRKVVVVPTYWGRPKEEGWKPGDAVYDHATPVDEEGTLERMLESVKILTKKDFKLILLVCPTAKSLEEEAEQNVRRIVKRCDPGAETYIFTMSDLREMREIFIKGGMAGEELELLAMDGYANVRNMCLFTAAIMTADAAILIDDDEIFEDPDYIDKSVEFLGKRVFGDRIHGIAGYYLNRHNQYYDDVSKESWMTYWDRFGSKSKAFDKIIGCEPRIKRTPFAFGGAMMIHRDLYRTVPFDTAITRGEDIDYLINAKMYGFSFFLDNTLGIKHLPPPKNHPVWQRLREDIIRFTYEKAKLSSQYEVNNMYIVTAEDFDPYPGEFLKDDLEDKIYKTNVLLALKYMAEGDIEACEETLRNIYISKFEAIPQYDAFSRYRQIQKYWDRIMDFVSANRYELRKVMEAHNLSATELKIDETHTRDLTPDEIIAILRRTEGFHNFHDAEIKRLQEIVTIRTYNENDEIFKAGDHNRNFFMVLKGVVRLYAVDQSGEEIEISQIVKNGVIGESAIIYDTYTINGQASEFTELLAINKEDLSKLIEADSVMGVKLLMFLLGKISTKLSESNKQLAEQQRLHSEMADSLIQ